MKLNETIAPRRRIGPLRVVDSSGDPVVDTFEGAGEKEISVNNGPWAAASGAVEDIGGGYAYYQGTGGNASVQGFVLLKISGPAEEFTFREEVELAPQGIPVDTVDAAFLHVTLLALDSNGGPVVGEDFGGAGELEICINGDPWAAAVGTVVELDSGYYDYIPDPTEVAEVGWIALKLAGVCEEYVIRVDIVETNAGVDIAPTLAIDSPDPDDPVGAGGFPEDMAAAQQTPIVLRITDATFVVVVVRYPAELLERCIYRRGAFRRGFTIHSSQEIDGSDLVLSILPDGGWPESGDPDDISIDVDAASGSISDIAGSS